MRSDIAASRELGMVDSGETRFGGRRRAVASATLLFLAVLTAVAGASAAKLQQTFATPEQAAAALVAAVRGGSTGALVEILGPASKKLVSSGDPVADRQAREKFIAAYDEDNHLEREGEDRVVLGVGKDDWPFPYPIVRHGEEWRFDATAGVEEILDRRIGANELDTIEVCRAYVDAQREYAEKDRNDDGFIEYAQKFLSGPGKHDGLYWPAAGDEEESPIGPLMAEARAAGYSTDDRGGRRPYHGYYYRILKGQGPNAKDGAYDYVVKGHMIAGFALVAYPAQYGVSGVMTFIVNHDGVVYQKDFGRRTAALAGQMKLFDPDSSWKEL